MNEEVFFHCICIRDVTEFKMAGISRKTATVTIKRMILALSMHDGRGKELEVEYNDSVDESFLTHFHHIEVLYPNTESNFDTRKSNFVWIEVNYSSPAPSEPRQYVSYTTTGSYYNLLGWSQEFHLGGVVEKCAISESKSAVMCITNTLAVYLLLIYRGICAELCKN